MCGEQIGDHWHAGKEESVEDFGSQIQTINVGRLVPKISGYWHSFLYLIFLKNLSAMN